MKTPTEVAADVIGLAEDQAVAAIQSAGFVSRIASIDGVLQTGIMNMSPIRINLTIENGIVTEASVK